MRHFILLVAILTLSCGSVGADTLKPPTAADEKHFATNVLPVLKARCWGCHGNEPKKLRGGLDLRTRQAMLHGGDSGKSVLVAGKPDVSPLILSIGRASKDWSPMPPKESEKLTDAEVTALRQWVKAQAPWPSDARIAELTRANVWDTKDGVLVRTSGGLSPEWTNRKYAPADIWAFQPLHTPTVPAGARHPVDAFLQQRLDALQLRPAPLADRRTLLRRVTYDLTGLPPTLRELDAFLSDRRDDALAFTVVVDRLLASPHYGERMAQHWLDITRYADSAGFANDYERGPAWRYRDHVVRSFNADKPYDQFVREQIAGDEIDPTDPDCLIAAGFLRMGPWELTGMEVAKVARQRFLDDVTDAVGQTFLGQPLQCARCHDHKFDPIPTRDYYAIQAVFATTQIADRPANFSPGENRTGFAEEKKFLEQRRGRYEADLRRLQATEAKARAAWDVDHPNPQGRKPERHQFLTIAHLGNERVARKGLERLRWQLDRYEPLALSVYSGKTPNVKAYYSPPRLPANLNAGELEKTAILTGGDPFSAAAVVEPSALSATMGSWSRPFPSTLSGRRLAFADWVVAPENPLTARVFVNRLWGWHFGTPLAGSPNNFGATGKKPTHPELLDWLAARLIAEKWSVKAMHRLILTSEAYRRSARHPNAQSVTRLDPLGQSYAVFKPRRLSAEEIRDSLLVSTGELNRQVGGIPCRPEMSPEVAFQPRLVMGTTAEVWQPNPRPEQRHRRSLYVLKIRGLRDPFFEVFNQPSADSSCELREASTVVPQALTLFNAETTFARSLVLADAVLRETQSDNEALTEVFRRTLGRIPSVSEAKRCLTHWQAMTARHEKLTFAKRDFPRQISREAVEENTGEKFRFVEPLEMMSAFVPDLQPADCRPRVRGLAEVCLVLFNTNEFLTLE